MNQKKLIIGLGALLVVIIAVFAIVLISNKPKTDENKETKNIEVTIVYKDKSEKKYEIDTDFNYLADVLLQKYIVTEKEYKTQFYTVINGAKADYYVDKSWWSVYQNGELAQYSMNKIEIKDGDKFEIVYTVG